MPGVRLFGPLVAFVLVGLACGAVSPETPPLGATPGGELNVMGTVDRGATPTCPAGEPCDPAMVAATLVFSGADGTRVSVRVGGDGSFALHLDPGDYTIAAEPPPFSGALDPSSVQVPKTGSIVLHLHVVSSP